MLLNYLFPVLKNGLEELKISLIPKYHEIAATIQVQKAELEKHSKRLTTALCKRGEEWHREIDEIINKRKTEINQMQIIYLAALNKQKTEITQSIFLIAQRIVDLKKLLGFNNVYAVSAYKSKNDSFRKLSAFSIESQEYDFKMKSTRTASPSSDICRNPLLNQPKIIKIINTDFEHIFSVTCSTDEQIWTRGDSNIIKL